MRQVSLVEFMALVTFFCVLFASASWFSRGAFAGLAGVATVFTLRLAEADDVPLVVRLAWGSLLATYLTAAAMAFWGL